MRNDKDNINHEDERNKDLGINEVYQKYVDLYIHLDNLRFGYLAGILIVSTGIIGILKSFENSPIFYAIVGIALIIIALILNIYGGTLRKFVRGQDYICLMLAEIEEKSKHIFNEKILSPKESRKFISFYSRKKQFLLEDHNKYNKYFFSWGEIPGNDNIRLIKFLMQKFGIDWVKTSQIEKIDNGMTIRLTHVNNFLTLKLNNEQTEVNIEIDDGRTFELNVRTENSKLNIYYNTSFILNERQSRIYQTILNCVTTILYYSGLILIICNIGYLIYTYWGFIRQLI